MTDGICYCGVKFYARGNKKYCSPCCREQSKWARKPKQLCVVCNQPTGWRLNDNRVAKPIHNTCKPRPRPRGNAVTEWRCEHCSKSCFRPPTKGQSPKYCGPQCAALAVFNRRRARKTDAFIEDVNRTEVFLADGYVCHLCDKKTDPTKSYPHPMSPTVDHVVPLSKGGLHERSNCRTAHARCNWAKQDRGGGEQFALTLNIS